MGHIAPHAVRRLLTPRPGARVAALLATGCLVAAVTACTGGQGDGTAGRPVGTGDTFEATIRRTSAGVPHITGDSLGDVAFGQGGRAARIGPATSPTRSSRSEASGPAGSVPARMTPT